MLTSLLLLVLWVGVIYVCYRFIVLNITHLEKQD